MVVFVSVQHFVISGRLERPQSLRKEEGITIQGRGGDPPPASVVRRQVPSAGKQTQSHRLRLGASWSVRIGPGSMLHQ